MPPQSTQAPPKPTSPKTDPSPSETVSAGIPQFKRTPEPTPVESPTRDQMSPPEILSGAGDDSVPEDPTLDSGPMPGSRTRRFKLKLRLLSGKVDSDARDLILQGTSTALASIGQLLHLQFANPRRFGPNDVWLADDDDHKYIAVPLANIAARRAPAGLGEDSDLGDLIVASIATGGYAVKNLQRRGQLARLAASGAWSAAEAANPVGNSAGPDLASSPVGAE